MCVSGCVICCCLCLFVGQCLSVCGKAGDEGVHAMGGKKKRHKEDYKMVFTLLHWLSKNCEILSSPANFCFHLLLLLLCRACGVVFPRAGGEVYKYGGARWWILSCLSYQLPLALPHIHTHNSFSTGTLTRWRPLQPSSGPPPRAAASPPRVVSSHLNCYKCKLPKAPSPAARALRTSKQGRSDESSARVVVLTRRHAPPSLLLRSRRPRKR